MTIDEWSRLHALRASLWGEHRAPVPSLDILRMSLPVVAGIDFEAAARWLAEAATDGDAFVPSAADLAAAFKTSDDQLMPTFDEAFELVFGQRSRVLRGDFAGVPEVVASWASRAGLDRLRVLPVFDPQYGELRRADLRRSWEAHVEAWRERRLAVRALPSGDRPAGLKRLDPLAALGLDGQRQLGAGQ